MRSNDRRSGGPLCPNIYGMTETIATPPPTPTRCSTLFACVAIALPTLARPFHAFRLPLLCHDYFVIIVALVDGPGDPRQSLVTIMNTPCRSVGCSWATIRIAKCGRVATPLRARRGGPRHRLTAIYVLVRNETGSRPLAFLAILAFGVSLKYQETVTWYAASFWLLGMDWITRICRRSALAAQNRPVWGVATFTLAALARAGTPGQSSQDHVVPLSLGR